MWLFWNGIGCNEETDGNKDGIKLGIEEGNEKEEEEEEEEEVEPGEVVIEVDEEDSEEEADVNADVDGIGNNAVKNCVHHFGTTICWFWLLEVAVAVGLTISSSSSPFLPNGAEFNFFKWYWYPTWIGINKCSKQVLNISIPKPGQL